MTLEQLMDWLKLEPHPREGGYFVETYRADEELLPSASGGLPVRYQGRRSLGTAIYYLLTPDTFSAMHRLNSDEIFHFYYGDPVEMLLLYPDGRGVKRVLGTDFASGMSPQIVVPRGIWQGARLIPGGRFALMGTTVAPGFDFADYETGEREPLVAAYSAFADHISALCP